MVWLGVLPPQRAHPRILLKGEASGSHYRKQGAAAPYTQCQLELGAVSDACLVTPNPAVGVGFSSISLEGTTELVALFLLPFFLSGARYSINFSQPSLVGSFAQS